MTQNLDSFSAGKNTSSWILKCITRPQRLMDFTIILLRKETLHKAKKEKKKHRRKIMLIFWNVYLSLSFCSFDFVMERVIHMRMWQSSFNGVNAWKTTDRLEKEIQSKKKNKTFLVLKKKNAYIIKRKWWVTAALFRFKNKTNNGRENPDPNRLCSSFPLFADFDASQHLNS